MNTLWVIVGLLVVVGILFVVAVSTYNSLVRQREQVRASRAQIDVLLKRRYDLIPNLVETVKGYAGHEKETLERVIAARNNAVAMSGTGDVAKVGQAEAQLSGAVRQIFALSEAYPDLKANQNFMQLQGELTNTENQIAGGGGHYNNGVKDYNTSVMSFPTNLIAGIFGFRTESFFELTNPVEREAPRVKF